MKNKITANKIQSGKKNKQAKKTWKKIKFAKVAVTR